MELRLPPIPPTTAPTKRSGNQGIKIEWTPAMLDELTRRFPTEFNKDIAASLGVSWRSVVRKARELGLEKVENFHTITGKERGRRAHAKRKHNPSQMGKGFVIPGSEVYRFKNGHTPRIAWDTELVNRIHAKRNDTIARDRLRKKYGMSRLTKFKFNEIA